MERRTIKCYHCGHEVDAPCDELGQGDSRTCQVCEHCGTKIDLAAKKCPPGVEGVQYDVAWIKFEVACEAAGIDNPWTVVELNESFVMAFGRMRSVLFKDQQRRFDAALEALGFADEDKRHLESIVTGIFIGGTNRIVPEGNPDANRQGFESDPGDDGTSGNE